MKIPFTASARTAMLIGAENFSNPEGAIIELVKNAYDADSPSCYILFDGKNEHFSDIYIIDFGGGMDIPTINDCWMQIGTDNKQQNIETANGRIKSGAKGIGRFALNRLGSKAVMYTHKDGQDAFSWKVNWNDFNAPGKRINEIMADLEVVPLATIQEKMSSVASHFCIELPDFKTGTILNIKGLSDVWGVDSLCHLQGALQDLVPPFSMSNFKLYLYAIGVGELGRIDRNFYEDYDYKVSAAYNGDVLNLTIARNELDVNILTAEYKDVFELEEMQSNNYSMASFERGYISKQMSLLDLNVEHVKLLEQNIDKIGNFKFDFYFVKSSKSDIRTENSDAKYPYRS